RRQGGRQPVGPVGQEPAEVGQPLHGRRERPGGWPGVQQALVFHHRIAVAPLPLVTLTSDFGEGSPYVAAMKAIVLAGCPAAALVDVSHSVPAFDVVSGAFVLWAGAHHFGAQTVHLAVVDPGVGSARRAVAFSLEGSFYVG